MDEIKTSEHADVLKLDLPEQDGTRGYTGLVLRIFSMTAAIIADSRKDNDYRISLMNDLAINIIPDQEVRDRLRKMKKEMIEERCNDQSCDRDKIDLIKRDVSIEMMGYVSDDLDRSIGINHKLSVGFA